MNILLNLKNTPYVKSGAEKMLLPDDLRLQFTSDIYNIDDLICIVENGKSKKKYRVKDHVLAITDVVAGEIKITMQMTVRGNTVKMWSVSPIIVEESPDGSYLFDELEDLKTRIANLEEKTKIIM